MANRAGRGYSFEQIRARALAPRNLGKKHTLVCEECLKAFPSDAPGMLFHLGIAVCPACMESNTKVVARADAHSTETSE